MNLLHASSLVSHLLVPGETLLAVDPVELPILVPHKQAFGCARSVVRRRLPIQDIHVDQSRLASPVRQSKSQSLAEHLNFLITPAA